MDEPFLQWTRQCYNSITYIAISSAAAAADDDDDVVIFESLKKNRENPLVCLHYIFILWY
jgi:hypothetical protein